MHLGGLGDFGLSIVTTKFVEFTRPHTTQQLNEKKENNLTMLEIISSLSYSKFDDIKVCTTTK